MTAVSPGGTGDRGNLLIAAQIFPNTHYKMKVMLSQPVRMQESNMLRRLGVLDVVLVIAVVVLCGSIR